MLKKAKKAIARLTYPTRQVFVRFGNKNERQIMLNHRDENGHGYRYDEHGNRVYFAHALNYAHWSEIRQPLTRQQAKDWVADLRSGKFEQGHYSLATIVTVDEEIAPGVFEEKEVCQYCCLGVLARNEIEIVGYKGKRNNFTGDLQSFDDRDAYINGYDYMPRDLQERYMNLNDASGYTFAEIADQIEKDFNLG